MFFWGMFIDGSGNCSTVAPQLLPSPTHIARSGNVHSPHKWPNSALKSPYTAYQSQIGLPPSTLTRKKRWWVGNSGSLMILGLTWFPILYIRNNKNNRSCAMLRNWIPPVRKTMMFQKQGQRCFCVSLEGVTRLPHKQIPEDILKMLGFIEPKFLGILIWAHQCQFL